MKQLFINPRILSDTERKTFYCNIIIKAFNGIYFVLQDSIFLIILLQIFQAEPLVKSNLQAGKFYGFILCIFISSIISKHSLFKHYLSVFTFLSGILLIGASYAHDVLLFMFLLLGSIIFFSIRTPFFVGLYEKNFHSSRQGRLYSIGELALYIGRISTAIVIGHFLNANPHSYIIIFRIIGIIIIFSGFIFFFIPEISYPINTHKKSINIFKNFAILKKDRLFTIISLIWLIIGLANLSSIPNRIVYFKEVLELNALHIMFLLEILPMILSLLLTQPLAFMFDRMNFITLRIIVNICMGIAWILVFSSQSFSIQIFAATLHGFSNVGANFLWNLWVLKIAPPGKSKHYMSVHTFFTGIRGIVAAFLAFYIIPLFSLQYLGLITCFMLIFASLLLLPLRKHFNTTIIHTPS